jgi:CysZ protein
MLSDALESFIQIFSTPFRTVMWKSLGLTAIVLFLLGLGLDRLASSLMPAAPTWLSWILSIVVALGLTASLILLAAPAVSLAAGTSPVRWNARSIRRALGDIHCRYPLRSM